MPNYNESTITGSKFVRARRITAENPLVGTPGINFVEEQVIVLENETITKPLGIISADLSAPTTQFNVLNPLTNEVVSTATYQDVYVLLYSLYLHLAIQRDNA